MTHTYRHTDRHTDRQTHTLGSIATYSVKMTEYKNDVKRSLNQSEQKSEIKDLVGLTFLDVLVQGYRDFRKTSCVLCPEKSKSCVLLSNQI